MNSPRLIVRRNFLRQACCAAVGTTGMLSALGQLKAIGAVSADATRPMAGASPGDFKALVCLFLSGGNDGTNVLVPHDAPSYADYALRRSVVALPSAGLLPLLPRSYADGKSYALNARLPGLKALFDQGKLAFLGNVGTLLRPTTLADYQAGLALPYQLYSHLDQEVQWQSSLPDQPSFTTGWGGRLAEATSAFNTTPTISMSLSLDGENYFGMGKTIVPYRISSGGVEMLSGFNETGLRGTRYTQVKQMLASSPDQALPTAFNTVTASAIEQSELLSAALQRGPNLLTPFPSSHTAARLRMVARMAAIAPSLGLNRQIFFIRIGGFDNHAAQMSAHGNMMSELDGAMSAFYRATEELGLADRITTFTASDFGRSYVPNSDGTDHGWGNVQWVMGGAVKGGDIYGRMPSLRIGADDDTGRGRWIPSTSVDEYNATLAKWFGVSDTNLPVVLPNIGRFAKRDLGFLT